MFGNDFDWSIDNVSGVCAQELQPEWLLRESNLESNMRSLKVDTGKLKITTCRYNEFLRMYNWLRVIKVIGFLSRP